MYIFSKGVLDYMFAMPGLFNYSRENLITPGWLNKASKNNTNLGTDVGHIGASHELAQESIQLATFDVAIA